MGLALVVLTAAPVSAAGTFPPHRGDSPWSFTVIAEPSSRFVVNDTDSASIDVYLVRDQDPIVIDVPIRRYVGPTDANGKLLNVQDLVDRGIVGKTVKITLPAFDVDAQTFPVADCDGDGIDDQLRNEVDKIYLNDEELGTLKGNDSIWLSQSFDVDISKIKFPGTPGATAMNRFRVEIDTANEDVVLSSGAVGCFVWAVAIDWIGIKFEASSPVVMVHGIRSSGGAFANFKAGLEAMGVKANDNTIDLTDVAAPDPLPVGCPSIAYNNTYPDHVRQLQERVPAIAERFGSETLHFVTHSKGGLDTRGFLSGLVSAKIPIRVGTMGGQPVRQDLEARSLITLDTPHGGSVLAKYGVEARQLNWFDATRAGINVAAAKGFEGSYYCDLTPARASAHVAATTLPSGTQTASVASDADCNGNREINGDATCPGGQTESAGFTGGALAADRLYQLIGRVADVSITTVPRRFLPDEIRVTETPNAQFQRNDVIVTQASAGLYSTYPITGWHHLNVHSRRNGESIAIDCQAGNFVDWRKR
jgi:pimeloyl-ACP methyl ester carboxylesterase